VASIVKTINRGVELLQQGKHQQAASLYRELLTRQPGNPDALHLLAVAVYQLGDPAAAAEYARRAVSVKPEVADFHSNLGRYQLTLGNHEQARVSLEKALSLNAAHPMARLNLSLTLAAMGQPQDAIRHLREYVAALPQEPTGHLNLGNLLAGENRHEEAMECFHHALKLNPSMAEAENNLGNSLHALGRYQEALERYEAALLLRPAYPEALSNKAALLHGRGKIEEARACLQEALRLQPGLVQGRGNLGNFLMEEGRLEEALEILRSLVKDMPQSAESWNNLGNCFQRLGRYEDSLQAYSRALECKPDYFLVHNNIGNTFQKLGRHTEAIAAYENALAADGNFAEAVNNLGVTLQEMGRLEEGAQRFEKALQIRPDYVDPLINLANNWRDRGRPEQAIGYLRRALELKPSNPSSWNNLGCAFTDQGVIPEALDCYRKAIELAPSNHHAHSNLLLNMHYLGEVGPEEILEAHREYGRQYEPRMAGFHAPHPNSPDPDRPIRIGYVSADFRRHSVAFFLEPILEQHDRGRFEVFCYGSVARPDPQTQRFQQLADAGWRSVLGFNHERFHQQVRADAIDILIDLGAHTANSRLIEFAGRPAPVQATYLGYPDTTGLDAMDYRITDPWADPPGETERFHTEQLVRLPAGFLCFRPWPDAPPVAPQPALSGQQFTFGSFNTMAKISPATLDLWAEILCRVPGSRIAIKNKALSETEARQRLQREMAARGVAPERVFMSGLVESLVGHLDSYRLLDLALDSWPYHGTTTTCEALWMGVPLVTLLGRQHVSRVGLSLLDAVGLADFAASTPQDYVSLAVRLAGEPHKLADIRADLRQRMGVSRLVDAVSFTAQLECAYRAMWTNWCRQRIAV